ncbi:hypothetical protein QBC45DRAFT_449141 [Copromyces sp. CBS 386.78]|nr:hypothetical protein QBC45DRAFT_449141 [Copromyces sp. CBS 386.78]
MCEQEANGGRNSCTAGGALHFSRQLRCTGWHLQDLWPMIRDVKHQTLDHWIMGDKDVAQHVVSLHLGGEIPTNTSHRLHAFLRTTATVSCYDGRVCRKEEDKPFRHQNPNPFRDIRSESSGWIGLDSRVNPSKQKHFVRDSHCRLSHCSLEAPGGTQISSKIEILKDTTV